jgi:hypothetical protein
MISADRWSESPDLKHKGQRLFYLDKRWLLIKIEMYALHQTTSSMKRGKHLANLSREGFDLIYIYKKHQFLSSVSFFRSRNSVLHKFGHKRSTWPGDCSTPDTQPCCSGFNLRNIIITSFGSSGVCRRNPVSWYPRCS